MAENQGEEKAIYVDSSLHKNIKLEATKKGVSMRKFLTTLLGKYIEDEKNELEKD